MNFFILIPSLTSPTEGTSISHNKNIRSYSPKSIINTNNSNHFIRPNENSNKKFDYLLQTGEDKLFKNNPGSLLGKKTEREKQAANKPQKKRDIKQDFGKQGFKC